MTDILAVNIRERLWHAMRSDLAAFLPKVIDRGLLMCPGCGRMLRFDDFSLEHLIPQQVVRSDPPNVRQNPATPVNVRAGNLLLCKTSLKLDGNVISANGCNGWKGRMYDGRIAELLSTQWFGRKQFTTRHIIGAIGVSYLALVGRYGYRIALIESGALCRRQFFQPDHFASGMPMSSQIVLAGSFAEPPPPTASLWSSPFAFKFLPHACLIVARSFSISVPVSRNPEAPIALRLPFVPSRYRLRPDFRTFFD